MVDMENRTQKNWFVTASNLGLGSFGEGTSADVPSVGLQMVSVLS